MPINDWRRGISVLLALRAKGGAGNRKALGIDQLTTLRLQLIHKVP